MCCTHAQYERASPPQLASLCRMYKQRTESQLTYRHLSVLTPSLTPNRRKNFYPLVRCWRGKDGGGWRSSAGEGPPAETAAKGTWGPEKGTGEPQKPPSCSLTAGRGSGSRCSRSECASPCLQAQGLHGDSGVLYVIQTCPRAAKADRVLSLEKGTSSAPKLNFA